MWRRYFKLVGLVPGPVIVQGVGRIDFREDVPVSTCRELFEKDFRYLEITPEGKAELYGIKPKRKAASQGKTNRTRQKSSMRAKRRRSSNTKS